MQEAVEGKQDRQTTESNQGLGQELGPAFRRIRTRNQSDIVHLQLHIEV